MLQPHQFCLSDVPFFLFQECVLGCTSYVIQVISIIWVGSFDHCNLTCFLRSNSFELFFFFVEPWFMLLQTVLT
jgi:hypothetical protein